MLAFTRMTWRDHFGDVSAQGFQLVGSRDGATRILCDDSTGLTLFAFDPPGAPTNDAEFWRERPPYVVAHEHEDAAGRTTTTVLIETSRITSVFRVLRLVRFYGRRRSSVVSFLAPEDLLSAAELAEVRRLLQDLSETPQPQAVDGFLRAVFVCGDLLRPRSASLQDSAA